MDKKEIVPVSGAEQDQVTRALLNWLNEYKDFPPRVSEIESEYLSSKNSIAMFAVTAPYKTQPYIDGSYTAQYQFALLYRLAPSSSNQRINAMDVLSGIAVWAEKRKDLPNLGAGKKPTSIERTSPAVLVGRNDDGSEDYQILMVFNYQVKQ